MDLVDKLITEDDERKLKSLATRIMSNGVEVLVKDKNPDPVKLEQRRIKLLSTLKPRHVTSSLPNQSLLSSAVATVVNRQQINPMYPMPQLVQHNYIIKTCLTTFTYLTTLVHNKRSAISTFETIVSVVTTESLTNLYATDLIADIKPTKTKFMEVKTIHPSSASNSYQNPPKIEKRIDGNIEKDHSYFDLIQPSEVGHSPCTTSCSCSHTKTEGLNTKYNKIPAKATKYSAVKLDVKPTSIDKKTHYGPYEFESSSHLAPVDKIVEKYTEVINDYSDEKDSSSVDESELLTNEQAPSPPKTNKVPVVKSPVKTKPEKPQKPNNQNKFVVADLLKLGSLGIKGLSQLAPVFEKMTGNFIKRQDNRTSTKTTSTVKPVTKITPYVVNKRIDSESNFPIYIPVDEMETSESQQVFSNATLHQSLASWADYKHPKSHNIKPPKMIHESPLVNGGIPISPGEIITANSDVIVGKPAVGGPLTLAASGIRLQNPVNPPSLDSLVSSNEQYVVKEKPPGEQAMISTKVDDSYDLRPPELPQPKQKQNHYIPRPNPPSYHHEQNNHGQTFKHHNPPKKMPARPPPMPHPSDNMMKTEQIKTTFLLGNHGRPAFLDYIPSFGKPEKNGSPLQQSVDFKPSEDGPEVLDNSPSSSEFIDTRVKTNGEAVMNGQQLPESINKPFLVDIQPSRVANVLIPHGSTTALVFAGSSEPHKTGDYVDDPLPYPEPGYFGSFSIDAPQLTNVHNVPPNSRPSQVKPNMPPPLEPYTPIKDPGLYKNEVQQKWKETKRPIDYSKLPPPTSNQETHLQIGPQITEYNPEIYKPGINGKFEKYNNKYNKDVKDVIDKEYENYLAVPPPPPPKKQFHENNNYAQKPIIHQKPIQDMKVFLNIQHPVPNQPNVMNQDKQPTKVTSEIYFASQTPQNTHTPTYTVHIPNASNQAQNNYFSQATNRPINNVAPQYQLHKPHAEDSFKVMSSPSVVHNKPGVVNDVNVNEDNTYTVTLNTATNVANSLGETGKIVGSSVPVSVGINTVNTDVPIGTNFAIKVEDRPSNFKSYNIPVQGNRSPQIIYEHHDQEQVKIPVGDNRWNTTEETAAPKIEVSTNTIKYHSTTPDYTERTKPFSRVTLKPSYTPSINSHANFPMVNEHTTVYNQNVRPVTEIIDDIKPDTKRPAKLIPNIPTNSHGWYSSVPNQDYKSINNIKLDITTRKAIPLLFEYTHESFKPDFGQKISSVGKPPSEHWVQNSDGLQSDVDKLFNQPIETEKPFSRTQITAKPLNTNYLPHNLGAIRQPVYDIPVRDNSDETTTARARSTTESKPIYEDSHEIYDGEDEIDDVSDSEVSSESMKVPIVSASAENDNKKEVSKSPEITLLQDEVIQRPKQPQNIKTPNEFVEFPGSQTEKPFDADSYNKSKIFQSNAMKPIYESNSQMKPRPFNSVSTATTLDHQMHQPHWQINEMLANSSNMSYEDNIELNIGEEISTVSTSKPTPTKKIPSRYHEIDGKYRKPQRPVFSVRPNYSNDSNIITSTVHIKDKKPLTVMNENRDKTTLPTFTISSSNYDLNRSSSEIIDLSPPPPTMDYFRPSNTDETIMGMSPPPPANSVPSMRPLPPSRSTPRPVLPIRTPPPYRSKPPRTQPPRATTQRPSRKPITRDEVSTYRPAYDMNNIRRPSFNRDQPSSQLLPPPRDIPSRVIPINDKPSAVPSIPNKVFPTPISSGWMTSSGVNFDFVPTPIQFPDESSDVPQLPERVSTEDSFSYYPVPSSSEREPEYSSEKPSQEVYYNSKEKISTEGSEKPTTSSEESNVSDNIPSETSQEDTTTDKLKVVPLKNRTRKPYPVRNDDKKSSTIKYKVPSKPIPIIRPTKTIRPELYPTRHVSTKKIVRPLPTRSSSVVRPSAIESSESSIESDLIEPSEVLKDSQLQSENAEKSIASQKTPELGSSILQNQIHLPPVVRPTHHAGNEVKISDEIVPTKTEFRTTVITLTKTLSEPPMTVSSIGYVNLTHTLTVTHTKTSLVSQSEGAVTQTLILTNTHTSTLVDVVTEIRTQVQPTTIIETVTKHIPVQIEATPVQEVPTKTKMPLDDVTMSSEENENLIIRDSETTENIQKIDQENEGESDSFFVVMNKSQNGGQTPPVNTDIETSDYDITRNEQVNNNGVSQVLFGEILLAGTPYLETTNVVNPNGAGFSKDCQPDCKASRNERCQRIDGMMKCVCRPGFARMFPDRPCKPTYTYSVKLALSKQGKERLQYHENLADNSSNDYNSLALATHEGINRMVMQSDLRDVYHGVHITGFHPIEVKSLDGESYQGVMNDFYVQLSDNAHESRLKEVIEKYLRNNNHSLGGTDVFAASEFMDRLNVSDFDECRSGQFHDCSEHAQCFNLRGTYTCSCLEGFADLSVNSLYPGRICSAEPVGCERCNYHGACYSRDDRRVLCECFQWYAGSTCHINLKVVLISLVTVGALLTIVLVICAVVACSKRPRPPPSRSIVTCIQNMPRTLHQGGQPSKQRADRRALITERADSGDASSIQNASLPYMPAKKQLSSSKKMMISDPPSHEPPPPPPPAVMIPRAKLHPPHRDSREMASRKQSLEMSSQEAKLISYLESGATVTNEEMMRRKHSMESSYSAPKDRHTMNKQGALVSAGFKVSTTIRPDESMMKDDDMSSVNKNDLEAELRFDSMRKSYSQEDISEWTDAERRIGELTLSEARSIGGTLPASTGRAASSTRLTHQEANTMAERDLGSTFLLPHVHLYKPDITSDVSEFDSL